MYVKIKFRNGKMMIMSLKEYQKYKKDLERKNVSREFRPARITHIKGKDWMMRYKHKKYKDIKGYIIEE